MDLHPDLSKGSFSKRILNHNGLEHILNHNGLEQCCAVMSLNPEVRVRQRLWGAAPGLLKHVLNHTGSEQCWAVMSAKPKVRYILCLVWTCTLTSPKIPF